MPTGRLHIDLGVTPARALARGQGVLDALDERLPVVAYGAEVDAAAVVLGAYQHAPHTLRAGALDGPALPVLRRRSGGSAVQLAPGVLYLALGLRDASSLMACPPGRILNRNVRGLLAGLRALGVPAFYFGRDFLSVGAATAPAVVVGWDERQDGRVLLECFVAHASSFELPAGFDGYPARSAPLWGGKAVTSLQSVLGRPLEAQAVLEALAGGYERGFAVEFARGAIAEPIEGAELDVQARTRPQLVWSDAQPEAIGFVSAGVLLRADGTLEALELGGDFFQQRACRDALAARLLGAPATPEAIGAAIDAVYAATGRIEGVRSLTSLRTAILDAVARAGAHRRSVR